jgi:hypothetical protein
LGKEKGQAISRAEKDDTKNGECRFRFFGGCFKRRLNRVDHGISS